MSLRLAWSNIVRAIGVQNLFKFIVKQSKAQYQQLQALIAEKKKCSEKGYQTEYEALCKVGAEQNEFIFQKQTEISFFYSRKTRHPNPKTSIIPVI